MVKQILKYFDAELTLRYRILISGIFSLAIVWPYYFGFPIDSEDYRWAVATSLVFSQALRDGVYLLWSELFGFGMPMPFTQGTIFHPLIPLWAFMRTMWVVNIFYLSYFFVGSFYLFRILKRFQINRVVGTLTVITFLFSSTTLNYYLQDFWLTPLAVWMSTPVIVFYLLRLCGYFDEPFQFIDSLKLGLVVGLMICNGPLGYCSVQIIGYLIFLMFHWRTVFRNWDKVALASILVLGCVFAIVFHTYREMKLFDPHLERFAYGPFSIAANLESLVLSPLFAFFDKITPFRKPFYGAVFFAGTLIGLFSLPKKKNGPLLFSFILLFVFMCVDWRNILPVLSASWLFRDNVIFLGILIAAKYCQTLWNQFSTTKWKPYLVLLMTVQLVHIALPYFYLENLVLKNHPQYHFLEPGELEKFVKENMSKEGRLYYSNDYSHFVKVGYNYAIEIGSLSSRGIRLITSAYKGFSQAKVYPDSLLMYGQIWGNKNIDSSIDAIRLLGIEFVVARQDEEVSDKLLPLGTVKSVNPSPEHMVRVYKNPYPPQEAYALKPGQKFPDQIQKKEGCLEEGFLCADFSALKEYFDMNQRIVAKHHHGEIQLTRENKDLQSIYLSSYFREGWTALTETGTTVPVFEVMGTWIGFQWPKESQKIYLKYRPATIIAAHTISWIFFVGSLLILLIYYLRQPRWPLIFLTRIKSPKNNSLKK